MEPKFKLDHFITYRAKWAFSKEVKVEDQILDLHKKKNFIIKIDALAHFAIPVSKTVDEEKGEKIKDHFAHLTWYTIVHGDKDFPNKVPKTKIVYRNQFTKYEPETLIIEDLEAILLPAEKIEKKSKYPDNLDHYLCYNVIKTKKFSKVVKLKGQFTNANPTAVGPHFFCVPCSKEGKEIKDKEDHLVAYELYNIQKFGYKDLKNIIAKDQWRENHFIIEKQTFLLVPTQKDKASIPSEKDLEKNE